MIWQRQRNVVLFRHGNGNKTSFLKFEILTSFSGNGNENSLLKFFTDLVLKAYTYTGKGTNNIAIHHSAKIENTSDNQVHNLIQ